MEDGKVVIGIDMDTKGFDLEIKATKEKLDGLIEEYKMIKSTKPFEGQEKELLRLQTEIEKTRNRYVDLKLKQENIGKSDFKDIKMNLANIGNSIEGVIKKVSKWALALFGIRSMYSFIRSSMATLSQYDDQLATDIEYIKWALAMSLKPVIEWIIQAVYYLIGLVGGLIKAIFNVNIFANASADAFKKTKNSLGGANKEAKQLQKTLAGFDEMNILQKDGSTSAGGGGGGFTAPSMDLKDYTNSMEKTGKKIKKFWEEIFDFWEGGWKDFVDMLDGNWKTFFEGIIVYWKGVWDILKGFGEVIIGLIMSIFGLITGDFDLVKQGFNILIKGIKDIFIGFIEMTTGTILIVLGFIKGILLEIWDFFYKTLIKPIMDTLNRASSWVNEKALAIVKVIKDAFVGIANWVNNTVIKPIVSFFNDLYNGIKKIIDGIIRLFKGDFKGGLKQVFDGLLDILKAPFNGLKDAVSGVIDGIVELFNGLWDRIKNPIENAVKKASSTLDKINPVNIGANIGKGIKNIFGFAKGGIVVPKLASGGIINNPGRGVPITSAIGGERGMEGVIPLTDSQQMMLLGEAIGRYITVNANITNTMNGRVISRELQKINSESDFAYNR